MAFQTKNSTFALVQETTEGTPVSPTGATQYVALQNGFSMEPSFAKLENNELTGSIGKAKSILGLEEPKASLDTYIKHSGVEGQAPNNSLIWEMGFGSKSVASVEKSTTAGSTAGSSAARATLVLPGGDGASFERGQAVLIKDGVNGYAIRNVLSVSTDTLNLDFNLSGAAASGVALGKAILYKPGTSTSGFPTASAFMYQANGAAVQLMAGTRVTSLDMDMSAGELIKAKVDLAGISYYFNPVEITASTSKLDFLDNATTRVATVAAGFYKDPIDFAAAVASSMNSLGSANTFTVSYNSSNGKYTIASTGSTLTLKWNTGANTANSIATKLGFTTAADSSAALTYTSANAISLVSPFTGTYDTSNPNVAKYNEAYLGDFADNVCFGCQSVKLKITDKKTNIKDVCAVSGVSGSVITERDVEATIKATLQRYDADKFERFRASSSTVFMYNFGVKTGSNWVAGSCGNLYMPTAVIDSFKVDDVDGLVAIEMTLKGFVSSGLGEVYLNFV